MTEKAKQLISKYRYPLLALALGLVIMLIPVGDSTETASSKQEGEQRLENVLERCEGVGNAAALLSENGAVIVCDGADNAAVRLCVTKAVEAYTGFSSDRIQVIKTAPNMGG